MECVEQKTNTCRNSIRTLFNGSYCECKVESNNVLYKRILKAYNNQLCTAIIGNCVEEIAGYINEERLFTNISSSASSSESTDTSSSSTSTATTSTSSSNIATPVGDSTQKVQNWQFLLFMHEWNELLYMHLEKYLRFMSRWKA